MLLAIVAIFIVCLVIKRIFDNITPNDDVPSTTLVQNDGHRLEVGPLSEEHRQHYDFQHGVITLQESD